MTRWRVTEKKLESHHGYETAYELYDRLLERSDYDFAPWVLLNGEDKRRTNLTIASTLVDALERALARKEADDSAEGVSWQARREGQMRFSRKSAPWKRPPLPRQPVRCQRRRPSLDAAC